MPFVTEEIWGKLPKEPQDKNPISKIENLLIATPWPSLNDLRSNSNNEPETDANAEGEMYFLQALITGIRDAQNRYPAAKGKDAIFQPQDALTHDIVERSRDMIESLANIRIAENSHLASKPLDAIVVGFAGTIFVFIGGVIDKGAETAKLSKRRDELLKLIGADEAKLGNEAFTGKAPAKIIQGLRDQLAKRKEELEAVEKNLAELGA